MRGVADLLTSYQYQAHPGFRAESKARGAIGQDTTPMIHRICPECRRKVSSRQRTKSLCRLNGLTSDDRLRVGYQVVFTIRITELSLPTCSICAMIQIPLDEIAVKDPKVVHAFQSGKTIPNGVRLGFAKVDQVYMCIYPQNRQKNADIAFSIFTNPGKLFGP